MLFPGGLSANYTTAGRSQDPGRQASGSLHPRAHRDHDDTQQGAVQPSETPRPKERGTRASLP